MLERIKNEPAVIVGLVVAVITLVVAFGVPISADQKAAIVGVVGAVLSLVGAGVTRTQVKPTRKIRNERGESVSWFPLAVVVLLVLILLAVLDLYCDRNATTGDTISEVARVVFRTHTPLGRVAFTASWCALTGWLIPHICRQEASS